MHSFPALIGVAVAFLNLLIQSQTAAEVPPGETSECGAKTGEVCRRSGDVSLILSSSEHLSCSVLVKV